MKSSKILIFIAMFLLITSHYSCKKDAIVSNAEDTLQNISKDAFQVATFNLKDLMDEMDYEAVKKMDFFQDGINRTHKGESVIVNIMKNPEASGLDIQKNVYTFMMVNPDNFQNGFTAASFNLIDADAFEKTVKERYGSPEDRGTYKMVKRGGNVIAWNNAIGLAGDGTRRYVEDRVEQFFNTSKENSLAKDSDLVKAFRGDNDINFWMSSNNFVTESNAKAIAIAGYSKEDLEDNFLRGSVNFEEGRAILESTYDINRSLKKDLDLLFKDAPKVDFSAAFPKENLVSLMSLSLDLKGINQLIKEKGFEGLINMGSGLAEYGLTTKDLLNTFGGDLVIGMYKQEDTGSVILGTDINEDLFVKLLNMAERTKALTKKGQNHYLFNNERMKRSMEDMAKQSGGEISIKGDLQLIVDNGRVFISNNEEYIQKIKGGGFNIAQRIDNKIYREATKQIFGMYSSKNFSIDTDEVGDIEIEGMKIKAGRTTTTMELLMDNKNQNALKELIEEMNKAYKKDKSKRL